MDNFMKEQEANNVFLPSYVTDVKDPADGQSMFVKNIFNDFNKQVMSVAHLREQLLTFKNAAPTPENEAARTQFFTQLAADFMPDIMEKHLRQVQKQDRADRQRAQGKEKAKREMANVEPLGGIAGGQHSGAALTEAQVMEKAYAAVDAKYPNLDRATRTEKAIIESNRLTFGS
jgi:hypothetical protein